ncbi:hypothetical protein [Streptomyces smyrnaeus]|uniref:Transposase n=1 Tax=Streptomyces smyrnaeus TaxID=1387713 RepID=A0ABS3XZ12_9ACTN|nr:hypothetical protein [Streptomyces smyrnaeus]MBO8200645.1 hypothetical protein [Streptomyces smyrnaeus]
MPALPAQEVGVLFEKLMYRTGLRSAHLQLLSMGSVGLCIVFWMRAASFDQDERGNAERRALFVGLWAPTLWNMSQSMAELEQGLLTQPDGRPRRGSGHAA